MLRSIARFTGRLLLVVLIVVLIAGTGGYFYLRQSLPQLDGTLTVQGLREPIEIVRDTDAVPHIYARHRHDALFGLGFVHAQDRLWQMESQRRLGQGRLAEIAGEPALILDRIARVVGFYRAAQADWQTLAPAVRSDVEAYVAGINAALEVIKQRPLPPEFVLLGITPEPWTGPDVLLGAKNMAWILSGNRSEELLRFSMTDVLGAAKMQELIPPSDGRLTILDATAAQLAPAAANQPPVLPRASLHPDTAHALDQVLQAIEGTGNGQGIGSNNWVVAGVRSLSGQPLLANDPHLEARLPSTWYLAHLVSNDFDVIGATIPGLPAVVIGRNQQIAWGVTNMYPDVQDMFLERLDASGQMAEFQGRMEPMTIITETIQVRGSAPVVQQVRITRNGPLLSDVINAQLRPDAPQYPPMAFRWNALDAEDSTIEAFLKLNSAKNWEEFRAALSRFVTPAQNFVYADAAGNIGYQAAGRVPIRASGNGEVPAEGWSGAFAWVDWVPFEAMPQQLNPPQQQLITANNQPVPTNYPYFLGSDWEEIHRAERITELLQSKPQFVPADFAVMQHDQRSTFARAILPTLLELTTPSTPEERAALELLRSWDGTMSGESAAAAIYQAWLYRLPRAVVGDELPDYLTRRYQSRFKFTSRFLTRTLADPNNPWCDDRSTPSPEDCAAIVTRSFSSAVQDLRSRFGSDPARWRWDQLSTIVFSHTAFGTVPVLNQLFSRFAPGGGDMSTVNFTLFSFERPFEQSWIAGYRQVIDLASTRGGLFIQAIGQSGNLLSPYYADYLEDWQAGRLRPMRMDRAEIEQHRLSTLRLEP